MLNTALVGISYNVGERIVWVNDKCAEMAGLTRDQLMGQSPRIFYLSDEDYHTQRARARAGLSATGTHVEERQTRNVHGEASWVLISGRCVEGTDPDAGVIWTLLDVTDRRKAEEDIRQTLERQRELNALRSRFVAMTSHEFRTPLASILSSAELLHHYRQRMDATEQTELLASIEAAVKRMTKMLDRILLIGRAEAEMLEFKPQPLALHPLLERLVAEAQTQHPQARSPVLLECAGAPEQVVCDETLLRHILANLLSNALKYSLDGTPVQLTVGLDGPTLVVEVQDQGIGIPANEVADMFQSFHRASNVGTIEGTGLGLAIVKKSVDLHGGHIAVDSEVGRGSRFMVRLMRGSKAASVASGALESWKRPRRLSARVRYSPSET
jgi:PAS domain S-box-containing protein